MPASVPIEHEAAGRRPAPASRDIVFFDGVCGLCNRTVDWLIQRDPERRLAFASLQGATANELLARDRREKLNTLVLRTADGGEFVRSAAVVRILAKLGRGWRLAAGLLWLVPLPLRDLGYRLVAAVRYPVFGRRETCRLPTPEEADRLLP